MAKSCSSDARGTEYRVQFVRAGQKRGRDVGKASKRYKASLCGWNGLKWAHTLQRRPGNCNTLKPFNIILSTEFQNIRYCYFTL